MASIEHLWDLTPFNHGIIVEAPKMGNSVSEVAIVVGFFLVNISNDILGICEFWTDISNTRIVLTPASEARKGQPITDKNSNYTTKWGHCNKSHLKSVYIGFHRFRSHQTILFTSYYLQPDIG